MNQITRPTDIKVKLPDCRKCGYIKGVSLKTNNKFVDIVGEIFLCLE